MTETKTRAEKKERAKLMAKLAYLSYVVNAETEYCVFLDYSGHVDHISIRICASKESYGNELASAEYWRADGEVNSWLKSKIKHLENILTTGDIDYSGMNRVVSHVYHYEF